MVGRSVHLRTDTGARSEERAVGGVVGDEEEGGARSGAGDDGADAGVEATKAAGGEETSSGLESGFYGIEGVEGKVDGGAGEAACLGVVSGV